MHDDGTMHGIIITSPPTTVSREVDDYNKAYQGYSTIPASLVVSLKRHGSKLESTRRKKQKTEHVVIDTNRIEINDNITPFSNLQNFYDKLLSNSWPYDRRSTHRDNPTSNFQQPLFTNEPLNTWTHVAPLPNHLSSIEQLLGDNETVMTNSPFHSTYHTDLLRSAIKTSDISCHFPSNSTPSRFDDDQWLDELPSLYGCEDLVYLDRCSAELSDGELSRMDWRGSIIVE